MSEVVITGWGCVTPLGPDAETTFTRLAGGEVAVRPIDRFDASGFPVRIAAAVDDGPEVPGAALDRKLRFAEQAAAEALEMAALPATCPAHRVGISIGSEAGRKALSEVGARYARFQTVEEGARNQPEGEYAGLHATAVAARLARRFGFCGPSRTSSTACASGAQAIGLGLRMLRRGHADIVLAGGCDTLVDGFMITGFALLGALSARNDDPSSASRPFDVGRDGFVLGEGAGILVLEREAHARARGARILGRLVGYGASLNAYRITDSPPDGRGAHAAMQAALSDGAMHSAEVGYINAHGTGTQMNDASESTAATRVFGDAAPPLASNKGQLGHLVAAGGAVELIMTLIGMQRSVLLPTSTWMRRDPACPHDAVPGAARPQPHRAALSNSFGFGGSNACLAVRAAEENS